MTHSPEVRREAIERLVMGESIASVSREMGIGLGTVHEWKCYALQTATGEFPAASWVDPKAERKRELAEDAYVATEIAVHKLAAIVDATPAFPSYDMTRAIAYAAKQLSDIALDWTVGRRGFGGVTIAAGNVVALPDGLTLDELRAIAAPGPDVSTPLIVNHE